MGYQIVKNNHVPFPNHEILGIVFRAYLQAKERISFIQVGACDGAVSDQAFHHIKTPRVDSVLVEPVPSNFERLKSAYRGIPNIRLVNAALGHGSGEATIYTVIEKGRWLSSPVARQLASFDKGHLLRFGVKENEIAAIAVTTKTMVEIFGESGFSAIDILQIDTEGFDAEVVKMALSLPVPPEVIYFENCQIRKILKPKDLESLFHSLKLGGYRWIHDLKNTVAIHKSSALF